MIETALRALLIGNGGVAALVSARVYPVILPQAPTYPAITFQVIAGNSDYAMQGPTHLGDKLVQIDCFARTYDGVLALRDAVMTALSGYRGAVGSPPVAHIYGAFCRADRDDFETALEPAGPTLWRKSLDFSLSFKESYA